MKTSPLIPAIASLVVGHGAVMSNVSAVEPETTPLTPYEGEGCWVAVFQGSNYRPPTARMSGPTFLENFMTGPVLTPDLEAVGGQEFLTRIDSLIVGPHAVFLVYAGENFSGETQEFGPGQRVSDLSAMDFSAKAKSAKVRCEPQVD